MPAKFGFEERGEMKKRFTEEQIMGFLREAEAGVMVRDLCRTHGFSDTSFYAWRAKFGVREGTESRRLKDLQAENDRLRKLLAQALAELRRVGIAMEGV